MPSLRNSASWLLGLLVLAAASPRLRAQETPPITDHLPELNDPAVSSGSGTLPGLQSLLEDPPTPDGLDEPKPTSPTPTESVVVNLIQRLVQKGVLSQAEAADLIQQAERDAAVAKQNATVAAAVAADAALASSQDVVVTHVPEPVKERMREEIKADLLAEAKAGKWGGLPAADDWTRKFRFNGDLRFRYEGTVFPEGNDNTGAFPDFNRINTGDPFDIAGTDFSPQWNADEERHRFRIRARFGTEIDLGDGLTAGLRAATGNDSSPVSTNQTMGSSGGNFSKYSLWLDRAYLRYELDEETPPALAPVPSDPKNPVPQPLPAVARDIDSSLALAVGRFDNPFFRTSEIMYDNDLGFDGFSLQARHEIAEGVTPFVNAGIFPIYNTDFNFATNNPDKFESTDKWLYGGQIGLDLRREKKIAAKFGVGYYQFDNVEGELSDPYLPLSTKDAGNTDATRPSYAQKGNTYMALRNIIPDPLNNYGTSMQYQYFGLASKFEVLDYNARIDLNYFEPFQISLLGEYSKNLAFDQADIETKAINNRGPLAEGQTLGAFEGGDTAWNLALQIGSGTMQEGGDWYASFGYRYVESDAVVDAFADSDFGLGGTNVEGFTVGAGVAITPALQVSLRWMGAQEIAGPPFKSDVIMFDINAKF